MKFMLFAATAFAATQVKRQLSVVESAIASVSSGTVALDNGIKSFSGFNDAPALESTASGLVDTINSANSAVSGSAMLGNDAATLATPIQNLGTLVQSTVSDLKAKKQAFVDAGVGGVVYTNAQDLQTAAKTLTATILSKVPSNLQSLGQKLAQPITDALADAVSSFADQAGSTGGSSSSSGSTPSSTAGSSSAPASSATSASAPASTSASVYTTSGAASATTSAAATATTSKSVATFTGAAIANRVNTFGVAAALFAGAALL